MRANERAKFCVSSNRRGVPVTARNVCWYVKKRIERSIWVAPRYANIVPKSGVFRSSGFFITGVENYEQETGISMA